MQVPVDLLYSLVGVAFVAGFCFGTAFTKYMMKEVIRKYNSVFGKIKNPVVDIL